MSMVLLWALASAGPPSAMHYELSLPAGSVHSGSLTGAPDARPDLLDLRVRDTDGKRYRLRAFTGSRWTSSAGVCVAVFERRFGRWAPIGAAARSEGRETCGASLRGLEGKFVVGQALADRGWHVAIRWTSEPAEE